MGILDGWRFCPRCATAGEHRGSRFECPDCGFVAWSNSVPGVHALIERDGQVLLGRPDCGFVAWSNSVPGVHALIERDGQVLLGRRAFDPGAGCWGLPGGFLEESEEPEAGLRREVREETGLEIDPGGLVGTWLQPHGERTVLCLIYRARVTSGEERAADDVTELGWFGPDRLPEDIGPSAFAEALSAWRSRHEHA